MKKYIITRLQCPRVTMRGQKNRFTKYAKNNFNVNTRKNGQKMMKTL